jgi:hypothetical protein
LGSPETREEAATGIYGMLLRLRKSELKLTIECGLHLSLSHTPAPFPAGTLPEWYDNADQRNNVKVDNKYK